MKTPQADKPTVQIMPLAQPQPASAVACNTLAELIHALGPRTDVAQKWGVVYRTLNLRIQKPETATLDELQRLAVLANLELAQVFQLAAYQMQHPAPVPATSLGRPKQQ